MKLGDSVCLRVEKEITKYETIPTTTVGVIVDFVKILWLNPSRRIVVFWGDEHGHTHHAESDLTKIEDK